ncbi:MAG: tetratricopeptide repeat protein [Lentisphaerae bacterium]|nr:tetratricopeptide repeat protein [Lentisphaerota bacterium]
MRISQPARWIALTALALPVFLRASVLPAQENGIGSGVDPVIKLEIEYAGILQDEGLTEYAEMVMKRIDADRHPEARAFLKVLRLQDMIRRGKWEAIKAAIKAEPDQGGQETWAMKLALADGYFAWGMYDNAQSEYEAFFTAFPDGPTPALNVFYRDSAYKYAQMLIRMNKPAEALKAYKRVLKAKLEQHVERQARGEMAELLLRLAQEAADKTQRQAYFKEIDDQIGKLIWIQDLWFGKSIVIMAHVRMLKNDVDGAAKLLVEYKQQLDDIDANLRAEEARGGEPLSRLSPMAQCRYLVGVMRQEEAEKLLADPAGNRDRAIALLAGDLISTGKRAKNGALHEFYRVFVDYPNTAWAADAGKRAKKVEDILIGLGGKITSNITPEKLQAVQEAHLQTARVLFNQGQHEKAADAYISGLEILPDGDLATAGLGDLARCYIELGEPILAEMTIRYLGERFGADEQRSRKAGDELLRLAALYDEKKNTTDRDRTYQVFFDRFRTHPSAPALLVKTAADHFDARNYNDALALFRQAETNYPSSPLGVEAIARQARCYSEMGEITNEIDVLQNRYLPAVSKVERPGHQLVNGEFRLGNAYRKVGDINRAYLQFKSVIDRLSTKPSDYQTTDEEAAINRALLEASLYYRAMGYPKMKAPEGKDENYLRLLAIQSFLKLVEQFPKSQFAPVALSQVGAFYTVMDKSVEAEEALRRLQKEYPDSPEAKNSYFMLGMNLLQIGQRTKALEMFKKMFSGEAGRYSPGQILSAGEELLKAGEAEVALTAFETVIAASDDRSGVEPGLLNKAKALIGLSRLDEAVKALDELFARFPRSAYTVEASRLQSAAQSKMAVEEPDEAVRLARFNAAVEAMQRARRFDTSAGVRASLDVETARIYGRKAEAQEKYGKGPKVAEYRGQAAFAYQGLMMFSNPSDPEVRPHVEDAYNECIPILIEIGKYEDAVEDCDSYLEKFPRGKWALNMRNYRNLARTKLITEVATPGPATPGAGAP